MGKVNTDTVVTVSREWTIPPKREWGTVRPTRVAEVIAQGGTRMQRAGALSQWNRRQQEDHDPAMCRHEFVSGEGGQESTLVWYFMNEREG